MALSYLLSFKTLNIVTNLDEIVDCCKDYVIIHNSDFTLVIVKTIHCCSIKNQH